MLRRFVAGAGIASIVIAVGTACLLLMPNVKPALLTMIWCFVPLVWGVWAMITPSRSYPEKLPAWGAVLGFFAGLMAVFVVNVPLHVAGVMLPMATRILAVVVAAAFYYVLWMAVRAVCRSIEAPAAKSASAAGAK